MKKVTKIDINDIKQMVTESIKIILSERMNVVDERLFQLAECIYEKVTEEFKKENYNIEFELPIALIKKYYPYSNPQLLRISAGFDNSNGTAEYLKSKIILINLSKLFNVDKNIGVSKILHELTHYVNDCEGNIKNEYSVQNEDLNTLIYFLRDTECNARCSQFGFLLSKESIKRPLKDYEEITNINKISKLLASIKPSDSEYSKYKKLIYRFKKYKQKIFNIYYSR